MTISGLSVGFTPKSDELIEDFHVEFPARGKDQVGDHVPCAIGWNGDEHDRDKVPVKFYKDASPKNPASPHLTYSKVRYVTNSLWGASTVWVILNPILLPMGIFPLSILTPPPPEMNVTGIHTSFEQREKNFVVLLKSLFVYIFPSSLRKGRLGTCQ